MGGTVPPFAWVVIAITLLLVLASAAPRYAGWLLIALVLGMVYAGEKMTTGTGGGGSSW